MIEHSPIYRNPNTGLLEEVPSSDYLRVSSPTGEPTGFPSVSESQISFNDLNRTFTISAVAVDFTVYLASLSKKFVTESVQISDVTGLHFIYFDSDLKQLVSTNAFSEEIITRHAFVSVIYWRQDLQKHVYFADERHGIVMDGQTHAHFHESFGTQYINGLGLFGIQADQNGDLDSNAQLSVQNGIIRDEDIKIIIANDQPQHLFLIARLPVMFRQGGGNGIWNKTNADDFPLLLNGDAGYVGTRPAYNFFDGINWQIAQVPNNQFFTIHILASNDVETPVLSILGNTYQTKSEAREGAIDEFARFTGLPFTEFVPIGTVIYQTSDSYTNIPKARIVSTEDGGDYIDYRKKNVFGISTTNQNVVGQKNLFFQEGTGTPLVPSDANTLYYFLLYQIDGEKVTPFIWEP